MWHSAAPSIAVNCRQSPCPGLAEKCSILFFTPSQSLASAGGSRLTVILGQDFAYSAFNSNHFSSPGSVSGLIASAGHSGSQTPQSIHSSGCMPRMFSPSSKQYPGHSSKHYQQLELMP